MQIRKEKIKRLAEDIIVYRENAQEPEKNYGINKLSKGHEV